MKNKKITQPKGFTLIELLVVISIIGLLSTLAVVALNDARTKSRDAKRVSDIKQIQTALELYYADNNKYPVHTTAVTLGTTAANALCGTGVFTSSCSGTPYMGQVPANPSPGGVGYSYIVPTTAGATYTLTFSLEGPTGGLGAGAHTASPSGIK